MNHKRLLWLSPLLLFVLLMALPFTQGGTRFLIHLLDRFTPLEITYGEGSLGGGLKLQDFRLVSDTFRISLRDLELNMDMNCLLYSKLCFDELALGRLDIVIPAGESDADQDDSGDTDLIQFPVIVEAKTFVILDTRVSWPGGGWDNGIIRGGLAISGSKVSLDGVSIAGGRLTMASAGENNEDPGARIELPQIELPVELVVTELVLHEPRWRFGELEHQHEALHITVRWLMDALEIESASVSSEGWGKLALAGHLKLGGEWPIDLRSRAEFIQPPLWVGLQGQVLDLSLTGSLADLVFSAGMPGAQSYQIDGRVDVLNPELPFDMELKAAWPGQLPLGDIPGMVGDMPDLRLRSPWHLSAAGFDATAGIFVTGGRCQPGLCGPRTAGGSSA